MRIVSWNVNGIRAAAKKGLTDWLAVDRPDVLAVQEVKAGLDQFDIELLRKLGYHVSWNAALRPGYSGTATFSLKAPDTQAIGLGESRFDDEGRVLLTRHDGVTLLNVYFPNASRDLSRLGYKTEFYRAMLVFAEKLRKSGEQVVVGGDWNTAHKNIDIKNWQGNQKNSGFTPGERALVDEWVGAGWVDAFRAQNPELADHYTWWSNRPGVREKNVGWRIDYHMVAPELWTSVRKTRLHMEVRGSDHCPVEIELG